MDNPITVSVNSFQHSGCRRTSYKNPSCVSGSMGRRIGNLISALSHMNATNARGPAFSQASFRAGSMSPSMLRGPRVGKPLSCAMHSHTKSGRSVISCSNGNPPLHALRASGFRLLLFFGRQDVKERRSPVMGSASRSTSG